MADGDTITILTQNNEEKRIRLGGIDCPESSQLHGDKAKQFVASMVSERRVRIIPDGIDDYGRTVATVLINGENVNRQVIAFGHGWVFRKYCTADYCYDWLKLEETARDARVGLWSDDNPQPPWEWRTEQRSKDSGKGGFINKVSAFYLQTLLLAEDRQASIMEIEEAMFSMVLPARIITVKIV